MSTLISRARTSVHQIIIRHGSDSALKVLLAKRNRALSLLALYDEAIKQLPHVKQVRREKGLS